MGGNQVLYARLTDDERNHGSSIASSCLKTFDEFFDLPDLNVLFCFVWLRGRHICDEKPTPGGLLVDGKLCRLEEGEIYNKETKRWMGEKEIYLAVNFQSDVESQGKAITVTALGDWQTVGHAQQWVVLVPSVR